MNFYLLHYIILMMVFPLFSDLLIVDGAPEKKYCIIVDAFSSGKYYAPYFKNKGYSCIHIQTNPNLPYKILSEDFEVLIPYQGDFQELLSFLETFPIEFILPGSEPGVEFAEELGIALNLFLNEPGSGEKCRNKYLTGEVLQNHGIRSIKQAKINHPDQAIEWLKLHDCLPVVVKPIDSAGADGFHLCKNRDEVVIAIESLLKATTVFGKSNSEVLIQEYVEGDEYIVNTVSYNSLHYVQSFMKYEKRETPEGGLIFETYSLVEPSEFHQSKEIFEYAFTVLDTLGIKYGPAHIEIVLTQKGPILIECNGRPHGHSFPEALMMECLGQTQIELSTLALMNPDEFFMRIKEPFHIYKHMTVVELIALDEGKIEAIQFLDQIEKLPSFYQFRTHYKTGDYMSKTIDLSSSPGDVFLRSENRDQIQEDIKKIRNWEAKGLFKILKEVN